MEMPGWAYAGAEQTDAVSVAALDGDADARAYRYAARLLRRMRRVAAGTDRAADVAALR
jgi:hypothetical protein